MNLITDLEKGKPTIIASIEKNGFTAEHSFPCFFYSKGPSSKCIFFDFGAGRGIMGLHNEKKKTVTLISEVLAREKERPGILMDSLKFAFSELKAERVIAELGDESRDTAFESIKKNGYKKSIKYCLKWPVYSLSDFDESLSGKEWKKLRNIRNRFYSSFRIEFKHPKDVEKDKLKTILKEWLKKRSIKDRVEVHYYTGMIDHNFEGLDMARVVLINDEPCAFSAGWKIPKTNDFYCAIGIFNYKYKDMGDFINIDDFLHIKSLGYKNVDFGGSDEALLQFKMKFKPKQIYRTTVFSISKKD
ncbi:MAG TPA: phosphatidylglycerol lysyltransferase domain-containing protein [Candidatus Nanoarchaeia archaeon]|nr:phosphatidylglycerol lysyltransferase domain-containing protein [Candidatus Nanoarchaeia archaeon]